MVVREVVASVPPERLADPRASAMSVSPNVKEKNVGMTVVAVLAGPASTGSRARISSARNPAPPIAPERSVATMAVVNNVVNACPAKPASTRNVLSCAHRIAGARSVAPMVVGGAAANAPTGPGAPRRESAYRTAWNRTVPTRSAGPMAAGEVVGVVRSGKVVPRWGCVFPSRGLARVFPRPAGAMEICCSTALTVRFQSPTANRRERTSSASGSRPSEHTDVPSRGSAFPNAPESNVGRMDVVEVAGPARLASSVSTGSAWDRGRVEISAIRGAARTTWHCGVTTEFSGIWIARP